MIGRRGSSQPFRYGMGGRPCHRATGASAHDSDRMHSFSSPSASLAVLQPSEMSWKGRHAAVVHPPLWAVKSAGPTLGSPHATLANHIPLYVSLHG
jgi:hypothetical protein